MTSRSYNVQPMIDAKTKAGGWNALQRSTGINRGTLKYIAERKRKPSSKLAEQLLNLGLIEPVNVRPRRRIEWNTVARLLAVTDNALESILRDAKVDIDRARRRARECIHS